MTTGAHALSIQCHPLTLERWDDLVALFGPKGASGGCWCMYWRLRRSEWEAGCGEGNRQALEALVASGQVPGLLGYAQGRAVGWVSVAPREQYGALERSRVFRRIDREPVWSVVCFYVAKGYRRQGVALALLQAAVEWVGTRGGRVVEGYPLDSGRKVRDVQAYMGTVPLFRRAGFVEVARTANGRPVMPYYLGENALGHDRVSTSADT